MAEARHGRRGDSDDKQRQLSPQSSRTPSPPNPTGIPTGSRTVSEIGASETEIARLDASGSTGESTEWRETRGGSREFHAQDRDPGSDAEGGVESEEFGRFKQLVDSMHAFFEENPKGSPIDAESAGLSADDVERLDLDRDGDISPWELEKARQMVARAEHLPDKHAFDGAYPVERGDYRRPDFEFDAIDTNRDGLVGVDEYYSFLVDTERITFRLDRDGDGKISRYESGLTEDDFALLDFNDSGSLKPGEVRRAVALGELR